MGDISRGIACRICRNNNEGNCKKGYTEAVHRKDECWAFQHKDVYPGLAEHSENNHDWRLV